MPSTDDRLDLAPRAEPGGLRAIGLALLVHLLLAAALTWGVSWKRNDPALSFEAELWSDLPQEAAPALEAPPPPPEPPEPTPAPAPPPQARVLPDAEIALEREKKRKAEEKNKLQIEKAEKAEKAKKLDEAKAKAKAAAQAKLDAKKLKAQKELQAKKEAAAEAKQRKENLDRNNALLGATGAAEAKGSALKSSGPSASYGAKVRARVKPNIVFTEDIPGNPVAEVEVRTTLDGTIISQRLLKPSGNKAWDDAVLKAIIRTESLPRDVDGRVPTPMIIEFRPKD
jgi:colicin import membrane protein